MILVDTSAWIDHLRNTNQHLSKLMHEKLALVSSIVLLELLPFIRQKENGALGELFFLMLPRLEKNFSDHDISELISWQKLLIAEGINGVSIPDLMIIQIAKTHQVPIFTLDNQFQKASKVLQFQLYQP
jgi:predicted nucleic acid-binding protein